MDTNRKPISAVMTRTICKVSTDQSVAEMLAMMESKSVSSVLVIEDDMILGIVTERDIVRALSNNSNLKELVCVDLMQAPVITVTEKTTCLSAYHLMSGRGIRHLAVTNEAGQVVGLASEGDLMRDFGIEYYMSFKEVGNIMSTDVCRLPSTATVADAVVNMIEKSQSCVVVISPEKRPVGILTERDIVRLCNNKPRPGTLKLGEAMRSPVKTARERDLLHDAVKSMEALHIRRLVVVNASDNVCGVLTHHEVMHGLESDYVNYLREIIATQARNLQKDEPLINEKLLLGNILRLAGDAAIFASDLTYQTSYATPTVADLLGRSKEEILRTDIRKTLKQLGLEDAEETLTESTLANRPQSRKILVNGNEIELQISLLLDPSNTTQGYLVLAQHASESE